MSKFPNQQQTEPTAVDQSAVYEALNGWFRESTPDRGPAMAHNAQVNFPSHHASQPTAVMAPQGPRQPVDPRSGRSAQPRPRRSRFRRVRRLLVFTLALLMVYVGALLWNTSSNLNRIDALPENRIANTSGTVYLMVGSDSREGAEGLNTGAVEGNRTDTIMLLHVPLIGAPTLVSVPRDSLVEIPGYGQGKINQAFSDGGPQLLIQTMENATGLRVDHYVEIGFNGIVEMTDALGGVRLCIDYDVDDYNSRLKMAKGCHTVDGETALAFVRMRYSDPKGDLGRVERQQQFLGQFVTRAMQPATLLNPVKSFSVSESAAKSLTVSEDTGIFDLGRFAVGFGMIAKDRGVQTTVPVADPAGWYNGQSVVIWDEAGADELFASLGAE